MNANNFSIENLKVCVGDLDKASIKHISKYKKIGVDTETTGLSTTKNKLKLVQIAAGNRCFIVRVTNSVPKNLIKLFGSGIVCIFHNASFDLGFLKTRGIIVQNWECTKLQSKCYGGEYLSLQNALKHVLDINIEKSCRRKTVNLRGGTIVVDREINYETFWDELDEEKLIYCVEDIKYLVELWKTMVECAGVVDKIKYKKLKNKIKI